MLYTLLKNERIVTGPRDWNPKYFEYFLQSECNIETSLPSSPIVEPMIFSDTVKLVPTVQEQTPNINPLFEVLAGPVFSYDVHTEVVSVPNFTVDEEGNQVITTTETTVEYKTHKSSYVTQELPLESAKNNIRQIVANNRWSKETNPITKNINEKQITIYTDRDSRTAYTQALILATDEYSALWKFPEGFFILNKSDLQLIVDEVVSYVQSCFDWESNKVNEINSKLSIEELKQIILE